MSAHILPDSTRSQISQFQKLSNDTSATQDEVSYGTWTSIIEILEYLKSSFDDETMLDALPLEASGNPGAWNAWQAHRKTRRQNPRAELGISTPAQSTKKPTDRDLGSHRKPPEEWNWDGVWEERVQKGIDASISDSVLFGNSGGGDDPVRLVYISILTTANFSPEDTIFLCE